MLLEPLCSNFGCVVCRIVLLKFPKSIGMHNGHEWVPLIRQEKKVYVPVTCQSRIRGSISRQVHTPHTITEWWPSIKIRSNLRKGCTSVTLNDSRQSPLVPFLHDLFLAVDLMFYWIPDIFTVHS
ncbi:hypothetical protein TNCV_2545301 [Trichonephila clavipes]|nr:hypothetical protein TNCV_2545301 [Trichonephila clavipes]